MLKQQYFVLSGTIFGLVSLLHFIRAFNQWPFQIGPWSLPISLSWIAGVIAAMLCVWALWLFSNNQQRKEN